MNRPVSLLRLRGTLGGPVRHADRWLSMGLMWAIPGKFAGFPLLNLQLVFLIYNSDLVCLQVGVGLRLLLLVLHLLHPLLLFNKSLHLVYLLLVVHQKGK